MPPVASRLTSVRRLFPLSGWFRMLPALVAGVLIAAAIVLALTQLSGLPPGGISRDEAIKIASGYTRSGADVRLITVQAGQFSKFRGELTSLNRDESYVGAGPCDSS